MTIVASVKVRDGVVLASDSMTSLQTSLAVAGGGQQVVVVKTYQHARKLFRIGERPAGVLTRGVGALGPRSVESLVLEVSRQTPDAATVEQIAGLLTLWLANLMEIALDGAEAYWSQPLIENGVWHGRLMHRTLPDGATDVALNAPTGSIITWPSVRDGAIAYERSSQTASPQTRVVLRSRDGTEREIGDAPSSEPSLGDGFIAFKQSERFCSRGPSGVRLEHRQGQDPRVGRGPAGVRRVRDLETIDSDRQCVAACSATHRMHQPVGRRGDTDRVPDPRTHGAGVDTHRSEPSRRTDGLADPLRVAPSAGGDTL
jgi:hypothetical protein